MSVRARALPVGDNMACVHGSTNGTNGIPISFNVLPGTNGTIGKDRW